MAIQVTEAAADCYRREMELTDGDYLRLFVKIYGSNPVHPNFSLGVARALPRTVGVQTTVNGITFYMEEEDAWYVRGCNLTIGLEAGEIDMQLN